MNVTWPVSDAALLQWSMLLVTWVVAMYFVGPTESLWGRAQMGGGGQKHAGFVLLRMGLLVVVPILVAGRRPFVSILLALIGMLLAGALLLARGSGSDRWRTKGAELEIGITAAYVLASAVTIGDAVVRPLVAPLKLPVSDNRLAALFFTAAILGFFVRGGTQIVRAVLNKVGSLPTREQRLDIAEYNRGRLVGSIERLLLAGMVAGGSYAALAFTIAAKGLVRSKEFDDRNFAEYFLIGTLASTGLAMAAGGLLRLVFTTLW
ncbi:MAG TPA: hypothetical protein VFT29_03445 [Gemmatimonadaceae bacterium]|nr:hypothetical protein [Gemmatimonadaceae bacterium]